MLRWVFAAWMVLSIAAPARAQQWAAKMFEATSHDFGTVARGAKTEYRFKFKNLYEEGVHVASVRSSCGCTAPQIVKGDLKTFEQGEILAEFNTRSFLGSKSATITVTFDKPFPAEVQLQVKGVIRGDVVLTPGEVDFGTVDMGTAAEKHVAVSYAGRNNWKISDARSVNRHLEVELKETQRGAGKVSYDMLVRLTKDAPVGYLKDQLLIVTNDSKAPEIVLTIEGRVASAITISPSSLYMGVVRPGEKLTKQIIVRGKAPFKIVDITCDDDCFEARTTSQAKRVHVIPVVFKAGEKEGKVARRIAVETDQQGGTAVFTAYAVVEKDGKPTPKTSTGTNVKILPGNDEPADEPQPKRASGEKPAPKDPAQAASDDPPAKAKEQPSDDDPPKNATDSDCDEKPLEKPAKPSANGDDQ